MFCLGAEQTNKKNTLYFRTETSQPKMALKYVAAILLIEHAGQKVTASAVKAIIDSVGGECDAAVVEKLIAACADKSVMDVVAEGMTKLASVPTGGAAPAVAAGVSAPTAEKKEETPEEPEEEEDDMGFGLFD